MAFLKLENVDFSGVYGIKKVTRTVPLATCPTKKLKMSPINTKLLTNLISIWLNANGFRRDYVLKEFIVLYTLENAIKREMIRKDAMVEKEEVLQEVLRRIDQNSFLLVKGDMINTSQIRYIRVKAEQINSNHHTLKNI